MKHERLKKLAGISEGDLDDRYQRTILLGKGPEMEKLAGSIVQQLRDPEKGVHAVVNTSYDGWGVTIAINSEGKFTAPPLKRAE